MTAKDFDSFVEILFCFSGPPPVLSNFLLCVIGVMINKEHIIALLKKYKKEQSKQFGVIKMGIFGSVARGSANESSDIDIVVEPNKRNLLNRIGLKMSLEDFLGVPVDVVVYREDLSPLLKERITKDVIYV